MVALNKNTTDGTDKFVSTYYVRNPQGSVMAVYEHKHGDSGNGTFTLTEQHLYGSNRLGMKKRDLALNVANANESTTPVTHYELTNHLGNVMAVISDKASTTSEPTVVSLSDYYPFGMTEPGRSYTRPGDDYRFGYTGHEKENDLAEGVYTTEYRLLDTRLGRWMSVDPLAGKNAMESPYIYCGDNPIRFKDPTGLVRLDENNDLYIEFKMETVEKYFSEKLEKSTTLRVENDAYVVTSGYDAITYTMKLGVAYTDEGTPFLVAIPVKKTEGYGKEITELDITEDDYSNCHGTSMLNGQAFVYDGYEAKKIYDDEYEDAKGRSPEIDDVVMWGKKVEEEENVYQHSAKYAGNNWYITKDRFYPTKKVIGVGGTKTTDIKNDEEKGISYKTERRRPKKDRDEPRPIKAKLTDPNAR